MSCDCDDGFTDHEALRDELIAARETIAARDAEVAKLKATNRALIDCTEVGVNPNGMEPLEDAPALRAALAAAQGEVERLTKSMQVAAEGYQAEKDRLQRAGNCLARLTIDLYDTLDAFDCGREVQNAKDDAETVASALRDYLEAIDNGCEEDQLSEYEFALDEAIKSCPCPPPSPATPGEGTGTP